RSVGDPRRLTLTCRKGETPAMRPRPGIVPGSSQEGYGRFPRCQADPGRPGPRRVAAGTLPPLWTHLRKCGQQLLIAGRIPRGISKVVRCPHPPITWSTQTDSHWYSNSIDYPARSQACGFTRFGSHSHCEAVCGVVAGSVDLEDEVVLEVMQTPL